MQRDYDFAADPAGAPQKAVARIVECGGCRFALPQHTTLEIVDHPKAVRVPGAAAHALGLLEWQGRRIALIDAAALLANAPARAEPPRYALVVAMQAAPGSPIEHGAVALDTLPHSTFVDDDAWCAPPAGERWEAASISCFMHDTEPVAVLDSAKLFAVRPHPFTCARWPTTPSHSP
jgi:chemotaxis signal transduction protein